MTEKERLAHNAKIRKYQKTLGQISIRLPKDELAKYKEAAEAAGMTFRAWIIKSMDNMILSTK